ncbi:MAG TPA: T9SS type A sorting domain-containing protein [Bacteroidota bacterium]|nr:T9SS type A sorting domain-containing protein [Bacteroidota bacterium]
MIKKIIILIAINISIFAQENSFKLIDYKNHKLIYTTESNKGLFLLDQLSNNTITLENDFGASYQATISNDGKKILYKNIEFIGEEPYQIPMIYDDNLKRNIPLSEPVFQCGVPSISDNGLIAYMIGNELRIVDSSFQTIKKINIGNYINLSPISPNGQKVVLNDKLNQLYILDLNKLTKEYITSGNNYYYEPMWSNDGKFISFKNIKSDIFIYSIENKKTYYISKGDSPKWYDNELFFVEFTIDSNANLQSTSLKKYSTLNNSLIQLENDKNKIYNSVLLYNNHLFYSVSNSNKIFSLYNKSQNPILSFRMSSETNQNLEYRSNVLYKILKPSADTFIPRFDSVYFNQVYDCRIDRAGIGDGCCGAASALMGLMFYNILPEWGYQSINKSYSPYANYLSEIYTFKDVTYNISYTRTNEEGSTYYKTGYGIYGWIYRNNLEDTKGHMAELLINHGLQSGVDWNPTLQKAINEINAGYPLVLLNSLTSAGHYIVLTGYAERIGTLIFNDPYGDKNKTPYKRDKAIRIKYDYPGYSNGYANLNTAWCYIYMRSAPDLKLIDYKFFYDYQPDSKVYVSYKYKNYGVLDLNTPFKIKILLSEDKIIDENDIIVYEKEFSQLAVLDSISDSTSFLPPKTSSTKTFTTFLIADVDNKINEVTKSNNSSTYEFTMLGKPTTLILYPLPNSVVTHNKPTILISFDVNQKIDTNEVRVKVNGIDMTSIFKKYPNKIQYYSAEGFSNGDYTVEVYLKNIAGFDTTIVWSFKINAPIVSVKNLENEIKYELKQNYPNPFNPTTNISFSIKNPGNVKIILYDASGREIKTILNNYMQVGTYTITFDASSLSSGSYFYQIITNDFTQTRKMQVIK